jgi:hypothetical protein
MKNSKVRYEAAAHAMQSGVAFEHLNGGDDGSPKHLRVGVNSALVGNAALVRLLASKGLITFEEYEEAVADEMEREVQRYEDRINATYPGKSRVTLK